MAADVRAYRPQGHPGRRCSWGLHRQHAGRQPEILDAIFRDARCRSSPIARTPDHQRQPSLRIPGEVRRRHPGPAMPSGHPLSREACIKSTGPRCRWRTGTARNCTVLHISTADELALFEQGPDPRRRQPQDQITAETCVHFTRFCPPITTAAPAPPEVQPGDQGGTRPTARRSSSAGDDRIDIPPLTTRRTRWPRRLQTVRDCAQRPAAGAVRAERRAGTGPRRPPDHRAGGAKFAHAPALFADVVGRGWSCAKAMLPPRPGHRRHALFTVQRADVISKCGWSPFEGMTFRSRIAATWVNGVLAWDVQRWSAIRAGQRLQFDR